MRAKCVHESLHNFTEEGGDIIKDMGIGKKYLIDKWFEQWAPQAKYVVDKDYNIFVKGSLNLEYTQLEYLPDNLHVEWGLSLRNTKQLKKLPKNLNVSGFIDLEDSQISKLPNCLKCIGYINLRGTNIEKLPDVQYINYCKGLYLDNSKIKELPNNLIVLGNLDLCDTSLYELPSNLRVDGYLDITKTYIKKIPDDAIIKKYIYKDFK